MKIEVLLIRFFLKGMVKVMKNKKIILIICVLCMIVFCGVLIALTGDKSQYIKYVDFNNEIENGNIQTVEINENKIVFSKKEDDSRYYTDNPNSNDFKEKLLLQGIEVGESFAEESIGFVLDLLFYIIFFGTVILGIFKLFQMNKNNFKVIKHTKVTFNDIAGMDDLKNEMRQTVEVLKNPEEFRKKGIRQTKGIIFEGNPGNGKTLFAKALAEEADVNFIATKGADFQSAMMSMGARKIKALFRKARRYKPCIVFIDEFDGIGERRNYAGTGVDKENNRIITAMLNEMDGFNTKDGILVIAATNSYASLDPALIRPGRFDLKYNIPNPDFNTRIQLIDLYTKNKILAEEVKKTNLADAFENLSCSAIETILNEASMIAHIQKHDEINIDNIVMAARKTNCGINLRKLRR